MELRQGGAHPDPELGIEVRQRLVHQERLRLAHDRAPHRDALPLAAGELHRLAVEHLRQAEERGHLLDAPARLLLGRLPDLEPVAEVLADRHVRIEGVALEHHRDVAVARRELGDVGAADADRAGGHFLEPGDHAQQRRLPASGRADQHHELAVPDRQADVVDGQEAVPVHLRDAVDLDRGHQRVAVIRSEPPEAAGSGPLGPLVLTTLPDRAYTGQHAKSDRRAGDVRRAAHRGVERRLGRPRSPRHHRARGADDRRGCVRSRCGRARERGHRRGDRRRRRPARARWPAHLRRRRNLRQARPRRCRRVRVDVRRSARARHRPRRRRCHERRHGAGARRGRRRRRRVRDRRRRRSARSTPSSGSARAAGRRT